MHDNFFDDLVEAICAKVAQQLAVRVAALQKTPTKQLWVTTKEAALIGSMGRSTLEVYRAKNIGPPYTKLPSGQVRYLREDLEKWLSQRRPA